MLYHIQHIGIPNFRLLGYCFEKSSCNGKKKTWFGTYHGPCNKWLPVGWQAPIQPTLQWDQEIQEGVCHCRPEKHQPLGFTLEQGRIGTVTTGAVTGSTTQDSRGEPPSVCMIVICIYILYIFKYIYIYTRIHTVYNITVFENKSGDNGLSVHILLNLSHTHVYCTYIYTWHDFPICWNILQPQSMCISLEPRPKHCQLA